MFEIFFGDFLFLIKLFWGLSFPYKNYKISLIHCLRFHLSYMLSDTNFDKFYIKSAVFSINNYTPFYN